MSNSRICFKLGVASFLFVAGAVLVSSVHGQSDTDPASLNRRLQELDREGKYTEAIPTAEQYVTVARTRYGEDSPEYVTAIGWLGRAYRETSRFEEAEQLYRSALAIVEKHLGPNHPAMAVRLNNLADLLQVTNRLAEAETLFRRALAIDEKNLGTNHPEVAIDLAALAGVLRDAGRLSEAEPLLRRALDIEQKSLGPDDPELLGTLNGFAELLRETDRLSEAEPLFRRALAASEKSLGPSHPNVAIALNNLALLLQSAQQFREAEMLFRRALAIDEKNLGHDHPNVAIRLNNLAVLLQYTNQFSEAEQLLRRALEITQKHFGSDHPLVATALSNLANLLQHTNRLSEAETLFRWAVATDEKALGPDHPILATHLNNLATVLKVTDRLSEAEKLLRRAVAIDEKSFGPDHPELATFLNNLGVVHAELDDWTTAAALHKRAERILIAPGTEESADRSGIAKATLRGNSLALRGYARAAYRADKQDAATREDAFEAAQWAVQTGAADALAQMSIRFAKDEGPLATSIRARQDLIERRRDEVRRVDAGFGRVDANSGEDAGATLAAIDKNLDSVDASLAAKFPEFAELANPKPLTIERVQQLLKPNEALLLFLDVPQVESLPEESIAWAITKEQVRWRSIPLGTSALSDRVTALRCGLDASNWDGAAGWPQETANDNERVREQTAPRVRCKQLLGIDVSRHDLPPFDLTRAHELYQALLAPFADLIKDRTLIIVPSGPLTRLPFQALVTEPPDHGLSGMTRYKRTAWLVLQHAVTVLPSVTSLQSLRRLGPSRAPEPYIGFGNPLLVGPSRSDKRAWSKQTCLQQADATHVAKLVRTIDNIPLRTVDLKKLREAPPLPETADEVCTVATVLGALPHRNQTVWLGGRATEHNVKTLSRQNQLARYRIVHFATHGLLPTESEAVLRAKAEPALILTPPKDDATPGELEEDDGLLTASEVANLKLDADWVVLSACNTAAGENTDAEPLSGLARAFFYANARSLLVSQWYVDSSATVKLITTTFAELRANTSIGRAEALRRSMVRLIKKGAPLEAHPTFWAPFVLVGEGAR